MIARLQGRVVEKLVTTIIVDVGGVGYEVFVSAHDIEQIKTNEDIMLYTYFAVRENAQELYGFTTLEAKRLFEQLRSVSGVGPKVALSIISLGSPSAISAAISAGDIAYISAASGVGKKVAEKVVVELKDKVDAGGAYNQAMPHSAQSDDDAHQALLALGYSAGQASLVLSTIDTALDAETRIKQALKELSR